MQEDCSLEYLAPLIGVGCYIILQMTIEHVSDVIFCEKDSRVDKCIHRRLLVMRQRSSIRCLSKKTGLFGTVYLQSYIDYIVLTFWFFSLHSRRHLYFYGLRAVYIHQREHLQLCGSHRQKYHCGRAHCCRRRRRRRSRRRIHWRYSKVCLLTYSFI